jgi:hypothetical protein
LQTWLIRLDPMENVSLLAPLLDMPLPKERVSTLAPEELRRRQFAALIAWTIARARVQPLVLAFEDLHWDDPTTLDGRTAEVLRDQVCRHRCSRTALLAHHFTQTGMTEAALEWWRTAGQRSLARSALL